MRVGVVLLRDFIFSTPCKDDSKVVSDALSAIPDGCAIERVM
jgi:hypothetical protein